MKIQFKTCPPAVAARCIERYPPSFQPFFGLAKSISEQKKCEVELLQMGHSNEVVGSGQKWEVKVRALALQPLAASLSPPLGS